MHFRRFSFLPDPEIYSFDGASGVRMTIFYRKQVSIITVTDSLYVNYYTQIQYPEPSDFW
jgi:hypothetical protein